MRKIFALICTVLMAIGFTGCGGGGADNKPENVVKIGMIHHLNASENEFNGFMKNIAETFALNMPNHEVTFFDNLNTMQMALEAGQIDEISTYLPVANYLIERNPNIEILDGHTLEFIDAFCFAVRAGAVDLKNQLNNAISAMNDDGTLKNLTGEYITSSENPPAVAFEHFDGAETLKVAVTGDLPPLDLVSADGKAAGFNTAVLAELGKRLQRNIEVIQVDSAARASALTSGQADIIFWAIVPVSEIIPANVDKPDGVDLTSPYYRGRIVHIGLKK